MDSKQRLHFGQGISGVFIAGGVISLAFGGAVVLLGGLVQDIHPDDDTLWVFKAAGYGFLMIGLLLMSFRRRLTIDGVRGTYSRCWRFGIILFRKSIPLPEFFYVLFDMGGKQESRKSTRQYRVCLARKKDKIGAFEQVDIGAQAVEEIAGKVENRDLIGIFGSVAKAAFDSRKSGGYVLYGI